MSALAPVRQLANAQRLYDAMEPDDCEDPTADAASSLHKLIVEWQREYANTPRNYERLYELARGIDEHAVESERPTQSISAEDTFAEDVPLAATADTIEALAARVWTAQQKERRIGRSVVLKLKTAQFRLLTRTLTPGHPPASADELAGIALALRQRVDLPASTRYRLVGVGLGNFVDAASGASAQADLFG